MKMNGPCRNPPLPLQVRWAMKMNVPYRIPPPPIQVRWAMKMDELLEQERQCRQSMANRAGVLALMLHSTYDHDVMQKVQSQQKKMASHKVKVKVP